MPAVDLVRVEHGVRYGHFADVIMHQLFREEIATELDSVVGIVADRLQGCHDKKEQEHERKAQKTGAWNELEVDVVVELLEPLVVHGQRLWVVESGLGGLVVQLAELDYVYDVQIGEIDMKAEDADTVPLK